MADENKASFSSRQYWTLLVEYLKYQKLQVTILGFLIFSSIGLQLVNPQVVGYFLDTAQTSGSLQQLLVAAGLFMSIAILRQAVQIIATFVGENVAWGATNMLRADLALHCLKLDMSFHKKYKPGELIERVDGDVNLLANFFSKMVLQLGGNLLLVIGVLLLIAIQDWRLGLAIGLVVCLGLFALRWLNSRIVPRWQAVREVEARLFGYLEEWLNGTEEIRTSAAESFILLRLYQVMRERFQRVLAAMRIQVLVENLPLGPFALAYIAAHILGYTLFRDSQISIGELYVIFYYLDLLKGIVWDILWEVEDLQRATASINRITEFKQVQPTIQDGPGVEFPEGALSVRFDQVTFQYADDLETNVLQDISFHLQPGTVLGLLGRTGSGKSTLTKLLFRFYDPSGGAILVGDGSYYEQDGMFDIRQAKQSQLRRYIGMVTQDVQLFQATLRENLTLFDHTIADERLVETLREIGLGDWYASLPQGLDTPLVGSGSGLSAGEAQLLAFARVFLADPGLVILDEASSRLDPATERRMETAIERLLADRTGIIIAHRLSTVERAQQIMILESGQIAEYGEREALLKNTDSLFSRLMRTGLEEALA